MKYALLTFLLLLVQTSYFVVCAQSDLFDFIIIKGKVIDKSIGNCIPSANIFNESDRHWEHANESGEFKLWVDIGDTLVFSSIGYLSELIIVSMNQIKDSMIINLEARSYEIGEAIIKVPKKYSQFEQDFINLDLPQTELDRVSEKLNETANQVALKADYDREVKEVFDREKGTLFVLGKPIKTKKEKQHKKLNKAVKSDDQQKKIDLKFNREIVKKYTQLSEDDLTDFMIFCNFSKEFLLNSNEYEIGKAIIEKFKEYKKSRP